MSAATVSYTQYGSYRHGKPYYTGGCWQRNDHYTSNADGPVGADRMFAAGPSDDTPYFNGKYNPECSCCYLGFAHTTAAHLQRTDGAA